MADGIGKVYLVGAGPGDPGLITVRGRELLHRADVIVYDHLVNERIAMTAGQAERIFVGKRPDAHPMTQEDINRLLIELARRHACVVRLKGGDPFVFGRGGEEALALRAAGVAFEVVPGVTAGVGVPAYAGIPVTQRGLTSSVTFITGHRPPGPGECETTLAIDRLHLEGTIVFYMGRARLADNLRALMDAGRPADTPAAIVEWGTDPRQRVIQGELSNLAERAALANVESPALVVVGQVARLRDELRWFEDRPLFGRRVVVTRARARAGELIRLLQERGADVFEFPTVDFTPRALGPQVRLGEMSRFGWIVATSVNGVETLFDRLRREGQDARSLHGVKLCAISSRAAEAFRGRGLEPDLAPERYESSAVADAMERAAGGLRGRSVLIPRAEIGRVSLIDELRLRGAEVETLDAYRAAIPENAQELIEELERFRPEYVLFNSGSAARNLRDILGQERTGRLVKTAVFAAIGPIAARAAAEAGMPVAIVPEHHRVLDLVEAIAAHDAAR